jgi:hypothetical protein
VTIKQPQREQRFREDCHRCAPELRDLVSRTARRRHIVLLKTLPDPPHYIVEAIRLHAQITDELTALRDSDPELARGFDALLRTARLDLSDVPTSAVITDAAGVGHL